MGLLLPSKHAFLNGDIVDYEDNLTWRIVVGLPIIPIIIRTLMLCCFFNLDPPVELIKEHHEDRLKEYLHHVYKD